MASSVQSNGPAKDPKSSSAIEESQLEKSILRRGLATAAEIEACKSQRKQLAAKESERAQEPARDHGRGQGPHPQPDDAAHAGIGRGQPQVSDPRLPDDPEARQGLDGRGLQGQAAERRPGRRHQDPARPPRPEQRVHQAIRARGHDRRQALAQQRRQRDRRRPDRRPLLLRHGIRRRARPSRISSTRTRSSTRKRPYGSRWRSPRRSSTPPSAG